MTWQWNIHTLFPEWFSWMQECRPVRNAQEAGELGVTLTDMRRVSPHAYGNVDDMPYGGGPGMLIRADIVLDSLEKAHDATIDELRETHRIVCLTPAGREFTDSVVNEWVDERQPTIVLCGRYEGFDHRVHDYMATEEISIGPYVLSGGEPAAMVMLDACARKLPGALGNDQSLVEESHSSEFATEYPQYTRPEAIGNWTVPPILLSGHHANIEKWRQEQAQKRHTARDSS